MNFSLQIQNNWVLITVKGLILKKLCKVIFISVKRKAKSTWIVHHSSEGNATRPVSKASSFWSNVAFNKKVLIFRIHNIIFCIPGNLILARWPRRLVQQKSRGNTWNFGLFEHHFFNFWALTNLGDKGNQSSDGRWVRIRIRPQFSNHFHRRRAQIWNNLNESNVGRPPGKISST